MQSHREAACYGAGHLHGWFGARPFPEVPRRDQLADLKEGEPQPTSVDSPRSALAPAGPVTAAASQRSVPERTQQQAFSVAYPGPVGADLDEKEWLPPGADEPLTQQQAIDAALTSGVQQHFTSDGVAGSVRVRDVHGAQDYRECRAYAVVRSERTSSWRVACNQGDGHWVSAF